MTIKRLGVIRTIVLTLALAISGTFYLFCDGAGPGQGISRGMTDQEIAAYLDSLLKDLAKKDMFSGAVLLARGDKIIFKGAYGLANKQYDVPNRVDTKFNLGSMNKMFTAVAIAQLVEQGKLSYEDTVGKYLDSSWVQPQTAKKVKIEHLLTHTSGLGNYFFGKFWNSSRLLYRSLDDWKPLIRDETPAFEPGTSWAYSNTGMFLLGPIIEKVTGQTYFDYVREHIHVPAGMINTDCYEMDRPVPNLAMGYIKEQDVKGAYWRSNIFDHVLKGGPAGGGFSTVEDLFRFARALMTNKLVSKKSVDLLTSPKPGLSSGYGYGFDIRRVKDDEVVGHSGGFPGINAILQIYKKSGYVYAILSNYTDGMRPVRVILEDLLPKLL